MLKNFRLKDVCKGHPHCQLCRSFNGGRQFREHVVALIKIDKPNTVDFECPEKLPWGFYGNQTIRERLQPLLREYIEVKVLPIAKERFEICKKCEHSKEKGHKCELHEGCCFGRWRSDPKNSCPAEPPKWISMDGL